MPSLPPPGPEREALIKSLANETLILELAQELEWAQAIILVFLQMRDLTSDEILRLERSHPGIDGLTRRNDRQELIDRARRLRDGNG